MRSDYDSQNSRLTASRRSKPGRSSTFRPRASAARCRCRCFAYKGVTRRLSSVCQPLPDAMADQVAAMCEQLVNAVTVMMDAETSQMYRLEALKVASLRVAS